MNGIAKGIIRIFESVIEERDRAMAKFGVQSHPDGTRVSDIGCMIRDVQRDKVDRQAKDGTSTWYDILLEEVLEVGAEEDLVALDKELCQVMQVCTVWREDIQRRQDGELNPAQVTHDENVKDALEHPLPRAPFRPADADPTHPLPGALVVPSAFDHTHPDWPEGV